MKKKNKEKGTDRGEKKKKIAKQSDSYIMTTMRGGMCAQGLITTNHSDSSLLVSFVELIHKKRWVLCKFQNERGKQLARILCCTYGQSRHTRNRLGFLL